MLAKQQLDALTILFNHGSDDASVVLSRWLGRPSRISIEQVEQIPLAEATTVLGEPEAPVCACSMALQGRISGQLLLVFDDPSGLALADLLLGSPAGTSAAWGELQQSAALETANIIGCAYLNSLARCLPDTGAPAPELLPSPPKFTRDFAESLMQFALMNQAMQSDIVFLTRTEFRIEDSPVQCKLLFVPDAACLSSLRELLPA
ncbi:MAG: chemotaxis protein CheC [Planctomycetaceae bacterium]